jgi:hypothetical protein
MPRTCTICKHKKVKAIDAALVQGVSFRDIALQFKVGAMSVQRHQEHIAEAIRLAKEKFQLERGLTLEAQLDGLREQTEQVLGMFMDYLSPFNGELALKAIDRRHKQIEIEAKLRGEFQEPKPNENLTDEQRAERAAGILNKGRERMRLVK